MTILGTITAPSNRTLLVVILLAIWIIALASVAIHLTLEDSSESYTTFVNGFAATSIVVGILATLLSGYVMVKKYKLKN